MIEFLLDVSIVIDLIFNIVLLAGACMLIHSLKSKDQGRFEIGDLIAPPGAIDSPNSWFKVKRVDRALQEYVLETQERTTFRMTFEQAKEQCDIVEAQPDLLEMWLRRF